MEFFATDLSFEVMQMAKKICTKCGKEKTSAQFISIFSRFFEGSLPICRSCIADMIEEADKSGEGTWNTVDKICQWADIPFIPEEWDKIYEGDGRDAFGTYASVFRNEKYRDLNWKMYDDAYQQLKEENRLTDACEELSAAEQRKLTAKWGPHYDQEELEYLENLHQGLLNSQNIIGALNEDQALKLCKLSLIIEDKIRAGQDISKDLKAYSDLSELANLTVKSVKDANDFSSIGEVFAFLEKRGWKNEYYDDATRDEIDFTIKDIKMWLRYLYVNETGISEEIEQRIENLRISDQISGNKFNEKEFRDYMEDQGSINIEEEEFEVDL